MLLFIFAALLLFLEAPGLLWPKDFLDTRLVLPPTGAQEYETRTRFLRAVSYELSEGRNHGIYCP